MQDCNKAFLFHYGHMFLVFHSKQVCTGEFLNVKSVKSVLSI